MNVSLEHDIRTGRDAIKKGIKYLASIQTERGSWQGDYGGALFLLPMYVCTCYIIGLTIDPHTKNRIITYFKNVQNSDGGFGLHTESTSYAFTTVLGYVTLRILGLSPGDRVVQRVLTWIGNHGGAVALPSWGKFILTLMNLYKYEGLNPVLAELWLLPSRLPFHPGRLWCHSRVVYLPMAYLYARKAQIQLTPLLESIRDELYRGDYDKIDFSGHRNSVEKTDLYVSHSPLLKAINSAMACYERLSPAFLRKRALEVVLDHVRHEEFTTGSICIGPVNKMLNAIALFFENPESFEMRESRKKLPLYLFDARDGTGMNGYSSTELWDTAFSIQAIMSTPYYRKNITTLKNAYRFLKENQIPDDVPQWKRYYRHRSKGGWPFGEKTVGWPTSDCTAEGLKAALLLENMMENPIEEARLKDAVELILSLQNQDGGWATYEKRRGSVLLELLNPSEVFSDVMVEHSCVECTSACMQALSAYSRRFGKLHTVKIKNAMDKGTKFILQRQRPDGSWEGSWGICFTYGTWFGVWGLLAAGKQCNDPAIVRACRFLLGKQMEDGGWSEHWSSCTKRRYVHDRCGHVVMTSWSLLTLMKAEFPARRAIRKGIEFLKDRQLSNGDWPREAMPGVFNKTCALNYDLYRRYFPIWALGLYNSTLAGGYSE